MIILFDIDGVLADNSHRLHHITGERKDWKAFFEESGKDEQIEAGAFLLQAICLRLETPPWDGHRIIFLTGRAESYRKMTFNWLRHAIGMLDADWSLMMRADGDYRPDHIFKSEIVSALNPENILFAVEDTPAVVEAFRALGVYTYQAPRLSE